MPVPEIVGYKTSSHKGSFANAKASCKWKNPVTTKDIFAKVKVSCKWNPRNHKGYFSKSESILQVEPPVTPKDHKRSECIPCVPNPMYPPKKKHHKQPRMHPKHIHKLKLISQNNITTPSEVPKRKSLEQRAVRPRLSLHIHTLPEPAPEE